VSALSPFFPVVNNLGQQLIVSTGTSAFYASGGLSYMQVVVEHGLNNAPATLPLRTPVWYDIMPTPSEGFYWGGVIYAYQEADTGSFYMQAANPSGTIEEGAYGFNWIAIG
jgi:hypothetical protein